jgi:DNA-binding NarL/FixJ family response regulator
MKVMSEIRVLIIESNRLLADGGVTVLSSQPDIKAKHSGGTLRDILTKTVEFQPHVALVDAETQNQDGFPILDMFHRNMPKVQLVALVTLTGRTDIVALVKSGVSGFILKDASIDDFLSTIRTVANRKKVLPTALSASLFSQIIEHAGQFGRREPITKSVHMTQREREVFNLVAEGQSNKEIATTLHRSVYTVKSHIHNILKRLGLNTRLELAHFHNASNNGERQPVTGSLRSCRPNRTV